MCLLVFGVSMIFSRFDCNLCSWLVGSGVCVLFFGEGVLGVIGIEGLDVVVCFDV